MGFILLFAGRSVSKLFKSSGIKGLDGIVKSEAAAKIKPPVTRYPGNRKYFCLFILFVTDVTLLQCQDLL